MSHSQGPHHKILMVAFRTFGVRVAPVRCATAPGERGYALVALMALMTVLALFAMAAAPNIRRQAQRENEIEAIYRGEQVADAIRAYYIYNQGRVGAGEAALPTSMDQLLEGIPVGTKKVQVLRPSAAVDPLSADGEWRLIRPRSGDLSNFLQSLMAYTENVRPATSDPQLQAIERLAAPPVLPTLGIGSISSPSNDAGSSSGPFIGVSSESKDASLIYYYGIDHHNEWIFTPLFR